MKNSESKSTNNNVKVSLGGELYTVQAKLTNGKIVAVEADPDFTSILMAVSTTDEDGELAVALPRELIDAKKDVKDDEFVVLIDGEETEFDEIQTVETTRTLKIPVPTGTEEIEIIGTTLGGIEIIPEIIFDKEEYAPFDEMVISIISSASNKDANARDNILVNIYSSQDRLDNLVFYETKTNTGIFEGSIRLTPDKSRFKGDLEVSRGTEVTVQFVLDKDTIASKNVLVNYHEGVVTFEKDAYRLNESVLIRVIDPDENINPRGIDKVNVHVWSTTDKEGLQLTLKETGSNTGVFEDRIFLSLKPQSKGKRLRVSEGDTITAKYIEKTLPAPAELNDDGITTGVKEIFASALVGALVPPLERVYLSELELVDYTGAHLKHVEVGQQVVVQVQIENYKNKKLPFAYILQVKDSEGFTESLSWLNGVLPPKGLFKLAQSWMPKKVGEYTLETFVWEDIQIPVALSPVRFMSVNVEKRYSQKEKT